MHAPLQVCCVFSVTIRVTFDFFFPVTLLLLLSLMQQLVFASVFGSELSSCLLLLLPFFSCPSHAAQLCNLGARCRPCCGGGVRVPRGGRVVIRASVDLLQVESSAAARSVGSRPTARLQECTRNEKSLRTNGPSVSRSPPASAAPPPIPSPLFLGSSAGCVCITIVMPVPSRDTRGRLSLSLATPFCGSPAAGRG